MTTINYRTIQLPHTDANGLATIAADLEEAAKDVPVFDDKVTAALKEVKDDRSALQVFLGTQPDERPSVRSADAIVDNAWALVRDMLAAWGRLPDSYPQGALAREASWQIFGADGLTFTLLKAEEERTESETRLKLIAEKGLTETFNQLGMAVSLQHLQEAHANYTRVIKEATKTETASNSSLRNAFATLRESMYIYSTRVVATVERSNPESAERALRLLQPIANWRNRHRTKKTNAAPKAPTGA